MWSSAFDLGVSVKVESNFSSTRLIESVNNFLVFLLSKIKNSFRKYKIIKLCIRLKYSTKLLLSAVYFIIFVFLLLNYKQLIGRFLTSTFFSYSNREKIFLSAIKK